MQAWLLRCSEPMQTSCLPRVVCFMHLKPRLQMQQGREGGVCSTDHTRTTCGLYISPPTPCQTWQALHMAMWLAAARTMPRWRGLERRITQGVVPWLRKWNRFITRPQPTGQLPLQAIAHGHAVNDAARGRKAAATGEPCPHTPGGCHVHSQLVAPCCLKCARQRTSCAVLLPRPPWMFESAQS